MKRSTKLIAPFALAVPLLVAAAPAWADSTSTANLDPIVLNGSTGSGTAMVEVNGTTIDFTLAATGLAAGPHAAHIHFGEEARHECPGAADNTIEPNDGRLSTTEGDPAYGPIVISLTKTGDTSPKSALAVDRFASGSDIQYMRGGVTVTPKVAAAIDSGRSVVVVHGVEYTDDRKDIMSDLDKSLPASATDPAICGVLASAPAGGADTGAGGSADSQNVSLAVLGGVALFGALGAGAVAVRRARV